MSWEITDGHTSYGQFASGKGYSDLVAVVKASKFTDLKQFVSSGATKHVPVVRTQLLQLATGIDQADVIDTARGLYKQLDGLSVAVIHHGDE